MNLVPLLDRSAWLHVS